jgi:hypothetical protein
MKDQQARSALLIAAAIAFAACANRPTTTTDDDRDPARETVTVRVIRLNAESSESSPRLDLSAASVDEAMFTCSDTAECVVVETGCCDHCNGGALLAVNNRYTDAAMAAFRQRECEDSSCTKMACEWSYTPVCDAGSCARLEEHTLGEVATLSVLVHNWPSGRSP